MALLVPWITSSLMLLCMSQLALTKTIILRGDPKLTHVPQNITTNVTILGLTGNDIQILHNTSFHRLEKIVFIAVNFNPVWKIENGTFDKNILLRVFQCYSCRIRILPASFGPAMSKIYFLHFGKAISDTGILVSPYFDGFTSLRYLFLYETPFDGIDNINIPQSVQTLTIMYNGLTQFPNVSSSRLPALRFLELGGNYITHISDSALTSMSSTLRILSLHTNKLIEIGDITPLNNLEILLLGQNQLETIPDMLEGVPLIRRFEFKENIRMACDHRMCWMRLWDRVRSPIPIKDDVQCMGPPAARGHFLSLINPAFMQCHQGGITEFEYQKCFAIWSRTLLITYICQWQTDW